MLLVCSGTYQITIEHILCFIEENSELMKIITSLIAGSFWFRKFINQKRAEAFFGFYAKLSLHLKALQTRLEENGQLNVSDHKAGNIYSLIYINDYIKTACPSYKSLDSQELSLYKKKAGELKNLLLNTEINVYPQGTKRKEWYKNQQILFEFCEFLENEEYQHITDEDFDENENEYRHIVKCKALVSAINGIQESINKAKY